MAVIDLDLSKKYTYADYLRWTIQERLELIRGKVFKMSPAPNRYHQGLVHRLDGELYVYLKGKTCQAFPAPFDVRLPRKPKDTGDQDIITVVQPDICVVCDPEKLDTRGCIGAPDIVVEILSPGNNENEVKIKYDIYEESGVKEYWMVSPQDKIFWQYVLNNEGHFFATKPLTVSDALITPILPGFKLNMEELFQGIT